MSRLSSRVTEEDAVKASSKDAQSLEDRQIAEAIAKSASETAMDTSGGGGTSPPPPAAAAADKKSGSVSRAGSEQPQPAATASRSSSGTSHSPSPAAVAGSVATAATGLLATDTFTEQDVQNMVKMGFPRDR